VLNRPDRRNAITWGMLQGLEAALARAETTSGIRILLLRGMGPCFCSGIDLFGFPEIAAAFGEGWRDDLRPVSAAMQAVLTRMQHSVLPSIALLHGYALGLGLELALACDLRIAAEGTQIGLPEARLGLIPDVGGTTRLAQIAGPARARELILTGRSIDAVLAEHWGIVNAVAPVDELLAQGEVLAADIMLSAPLAVSRAKDVINSLFDLDAGLHAEAEAQAGLIRTADFEAAAQAKLTRGTVTWQGR